MIEHNDQTTGQMITMRNDANADMVCPNCGRFGADIREIDNLTCTWMCAACGWTADGADFDPGFDDRPAPDRFTISLVDDTIPCQICNGTKRGHWSDHCPGCQNTGRQAPDGRAGGWFANVVDQADRLVYRTPDYQEPEPAEADAIGWTYTHDADVDFLRWSQVDPTVFIIPDVNLSKLTGRIDKMNRTAASLDVPGINLATLGSYADKSARTEAERVTGLVRKVTLCTVVSITGEPIKVSDAWTFVGTLEHTEAGNVLRAVPDQSIPERFRDVEPQCDHCQLDRRRNDTYIVVDQAGAYLQLGKQCLRNYLGHRSPHKVAAYLEHLAELRAALVDDEYLDTGGKADGYGLITYLGFVAGSIRLWGWTSRSNAGDFGRATADDANAWLVDSAKCGLPNNRLRDKHGTIITNRAGVIVETTDDDWALARAAVDWITGFEDADLTNDYLWNLYIVASQEHVTWRQLGLAASLIPAYQRHLAKTIERLDQPESNYMGTVGKRQVWTDLTLVDIYDWDGFYGTTHLHKFQDPAGNILVWKTGSTRLTVGKAYQGKATVKTHEPYNDVKQTVLTRAAFQEQE